MLFIHPPTKVAPSPSKFGKLMQTKCRKPNKSGLPTGGAGETTFAYFALASEAKGDIATSIVGSDAGPKSERWVPSALRMALASRGKPFRRA